MARWERERAEGGDTMSSDTMRTLVVVCVIALTVMIALYVFTSTPLCEVFASERTETYVQDPWYGSGEPPLRTDTYVEIWSPARGQCIEVQKP